ncbi:MAG: hypothetical protein HND55_00590 [Pseudomonadota bacterium]|nr:MAG: hypothetical protein HND55_00590 [Pseudomonadota bacterium]
MSAYLAFGLLFTWLVGIGRYWDNPRADLWQYIGLGSVVYVFVLAAIIYFLVLPLRPRNWSYRSVLLFITLTSPPAVLYAIPVERFMAMDQAAAANAWFLAIVAAWRVALYGWFLRVFSGLGWLATITSLLLPLILIVIALTALNLEHVVFRLMSGIREHEKSANDLAYGVVVMLTFLSIWAAPVLLGLYGWCIYRARTVAKHPTSCCTRINYSLRS